MKIPYALLIPTVASLVGCASPAPVASNFDLSYQKVARTAHHWDVVAEDVVSQTMQSIAEKPVLQQRGVYVAPTRATAFNTAFREFMITHLVSHGASVSVCKVGNGESPGFADEGPDVEVQYDSQVIVHGGATPNYAPGRLTALAAGVAVLRNAISGDISEVNATLIGAGALGDWAAGHAARPTRTEIIVTTTIIERNRFVARKSDVYYVPDADAKLFVQTVAPRSQCPGDAPLASTGASDEVRTDIARQEMVARDMRRVNPLWRPASRATSYSY